MVGLRPVPGVGWCGVEAPHASGWRVGDWGWAMEQASHETHVPGDPVVADEFVVRGRLYIV